MSKKILIGLLFGFAILAGVAFLYLRDRTVATVGDYKITAKEVAYRDQVQKVFYPQDKNNYGKDQLVNAFLYGQILKNNGHEISERILREEEMRINQNTKDPITLKKIRDLFQGDDEAYRKAFILPTYAERVIYFDFFLKNRKAHESSLQKVHDFLIMAQNKGNIDELAREQNLPTKNFKVSKERGIEWVQSEDELKMSKSSKRPQIIDQSTNAPPPSVAEAVKQKLGEGSNENIDGWIHIVGSSMKPGQILQEPVDNGEHWMIVKFLKQQGKAFVMQGVFIAKDSYDSWLASEKAKVRIQL